MILVITPLLPTVSVALDEYYLHKNRGALAIFGRVFRRGDREPVGAAGVMSC